jgi:LGFP repeat-containing protein
MVYDLYTNASMNRLSALILIAASSCTLGDSSERPPSEASSLGPDGRVARYTAIREAARTHGVPTGYLLAGIANDETGLAMCWSEATWACQGPNSPDCNNGPVIAGAADGPCKAQQGGLGMFQFDAGTYSDTIAKYGPDVLTVAGQISHAVDYAVWMVKVSAYTTDAETDDKARAWIARFDPNNPTLVDQWIKTVVRYYNGCPPGAGCWASRYQTYSDGYHLAIDEPGGAGFWSATAGTRCGNSPAVVGQIEAKYNALGGCNSILGVPVSEERGAPDGQGRYSVFDKGSIYWSARTGAFEVHGTIRDEWSNVGWEAGVLGYPITDETGAPDGVGRYNVFERGSIYWTPQTGAHEVHGRIRDAWRDAGWEAGKLGYPIADEVAVTGGRRSDFQHGSITWDSTTDKTTVTLTNGNSP